MIEVRGMSKRYGDVLAVSDLTFSVSEGEVVGFLGPNGAGKSTTLKILTGYQPATSGLVRVAGFDVLSRSIEVRRRLGYLPESVPVYPDMRVEEFLRFRGLLKGVPQKRIRAAVDSALDRARCLEMRRRMIGGLSKGYKQRVGLADAIVHDPPLLILDEPTSGLDPNQRLEVRRLIQELGRDKTVILSSHILAEVEAVARRVVLIHRGRLVADGAPKDLLLQAGGGNVVLVEAQATPAVLREALLAVPGAESVDARPLADGYAEAELRLPAGNDGREDAARALAARGLVPRELTRPGLSLEELFRRLTTDGDAAGADAATRGAAA